MRKKIKILTIQIAFWSCFFSAQAQSIFKAGVGVGVNLSQVDGDLQQGFDRSSWAMSLRGAVILNKKMDISVELQYNEKGASVPRQDQLKGRYIDIDLRYAEVPILFNYHFRQRPNGTFKWTYVIGASYGRMLGSDYYAVDKFQIDNFNTRYMQPENFQTSEFSVVSGFGYNATSRLSLNGRLSFALNRFYTIPAVALPSSSLGQRRILYSGFQNYFASFSISYNFIAPKPVKPRKKIRT